MAKAKVKGEGLTMDIDAIYVAALSVPVGSGERSPLFTTWSGPSFPHRTDPAAREPALSKVSDYSITPSPCWYWDITAIAASQAEAVIELCHLRCDLLLTGPWLRDGLALDKLIIVRPGQVIEGYVNRRRCGPGAIHVWLRGALRRRDV